MRASRTLSTRRELYDTMTLPLLALTMGDPAGVGPEIIAKALAKPGALENRRVLIVGSERALRRAFGFTNASFAYRVVQEDELEAERGEITLLNDESMLSDEIPLARVDSSCGAAAFSWLDRAIRLAMEGKVEAIVTAPLHKEALNRAGYHYAGHTEILAEKTGTREFNLMLLAERIRVVHVTCHVAMREAPALLTQARVASCVRLFHRALLKLDGNPPRIAVCAYNPHGGEGGLFGREEIDAIQPAVDECVREGIDAHGPFPSDSIFPQVIGGRYDGVVAMYHDQGHIPFKLMHFRYDPVANEWGDVTGVNITLGLPIIRTSVDHGTAFDLAGTGKASERSLLDAMDAAVQLASGARG